MCILAALTEFSKKKKKSICVWEGKVKRVRKGLEGRKSGVGLLKTHCILA